MKNFSLFLLTALLLAATLTGCGHVEPATPDVSLVQNPSTNVIPEPSTTTLPDKIGDSGEVGDSDLLPATYAENLLSLADTATGNGISYSILDVQLTKDFGSRILENLVDLSHGGMDGCGNLLGNENYLFLTIQFTNTTDQTVEILRNQGGLRAVNSEGRVLYCDSETVYCDQKWDGGTPSDVFHWVLTPNESVTSEMGWILWKRDETTKTLFGENGDWSLYYEIEASDDRSENYFIDLKLKAE